MARSFRDRLGAVIAGNKQQASEQQIPEDISSKSSDFRIAEYSQLREEILKRTELQHQIILGVLVAFGTFASTAVHSSDTNLILLYPVLATCLSFTWLQSHIVIIAMGVYIREHIEEYFVKNDQSWEKSSVELRGKFSMLFSGAFSASILLGTQLIAILLANFLGVKPLYMPLFWFDVAILCVTFLFFLYIMWSDLSNAWRAISSWRERKNSGAQK